MWRTVSVLSLVLLLSATVRAQSSASLEEGVESLAAELAAGYAPLRTGVLDRVAVMDFEAVGATAQQKDLGRVVGALIGSKLVSEHGVRLVERARIDEVIGEVDLSRSEAFDEKTANRIGTFLGAQALVLGTVAEAGADYLLSARLVKVETGEILLAADATVRGEGLIALAEDVVVKRSRAGAIYAAFLPGGGQFYNGPEHDWKGYTIAAGSAVALATTVVTLVLSAQKRSEISEWDDGTPNYFENCVQPDPDDPDRLVDAPEPCIEKQNELESSANTLQAIGFGTLGVFGALYIWGFVDAAIYGEDYEGVRLTVLPEADGVVRLGLAFSF